MTDNRKTSALVHGAIDASSLTLGAEARKVIEEAIARGIASGELELIKTEAGFSLLTAAEAKGSRT